MARYRKIDQRIYSDAKFRSLSPPPPSGQFLFLYLLTGPHTGPVPGLFRLSKGALADELGWSVETVSERFQELASKGMARADWRAKLVWLPNALRHNPPANPNVVKGWANEWGELPECALKDSAFQAFSSYLESFPEPFRNGFETVSKRFRKQEQEQEQEQEQQSKLHIVKREPQPRAEPAPLSTAAAVDDSSKIEIREKIAQVWAHYRSHHPKAPKVLRTGRKEYKLLRQRLEDYEVDDLKAAIDGYHKSAWHNGANPDKRKYLSLELMMRDISKVQAGLEHKTPAPPPRLQLQLDGERTNCDNSQSNGNRQGGQDERAAAEILRRLRGDSDRGGSGRTGPLAVGIASA